MLQTSFSTKVIKVIATLKFITRGKSMYLGLKNSNDNK